MDGQEWRIDLARRGIRYGGANCLMPSLTAGPEARRRIESTVLRTQPMPPEFGFLVDGMIGR